MTEEQRSRSFAALALIGAAAALSGCSALPSAVTETPDLAALSSAADERACLTRAMYFESDRSSDDGLRAVGTVVMNRVASPQFPNTICGVVGQPGQFAAGVLTEPMRPDEQERIARIADRILAGDREKAVGDAMYFHQAGLTFPYRNMHYTLVAGGNAFYEKRPSTSVNPTRLAMASVHPAPITIDDLTVMANAAPLELRPNGAPK